MDNVKIGDLVIHGKSLGVVDKIFDYNNFASYRILWPNEAIEWVSIERLSLMREELKRVLKDEKSH